jgi:cell division protein FtsB
MSDEGIAAAPRSAAARKIVEQLRCWHGLKGALFLRDAADLIEAQASEIERLSQEGPDCHV